MTATTYILKFFFCSTLVFVIVIILCEWMRISIARENEYDKLHEKIKRNIYDLPVTLENLLRIRLEFIELKRLKYKNAEKTGILKQEFNWHYRSLNAKERNRTEAIA